MTFEFTACVLWVELIQAPSSRVIFETFIVLFAESIESISAICTFVVPGFTTIIVLSPEGNVKEGAVLRYTVPNHPSHDCASLVEKFHCRGVLVKFVILSYVIIFI